MTETPSAGDAPSCNEACSSVTPDSNALCPTSHTIGHKVDLITVKALLKGSALRLLEGKDYLFCPDAKCDVVYFDRTASSVFRKHDLVVRVGRKESEDPIPVCYCFDFTMADLRRDIAAGGETEIPETITAEIAAGRCACEVKNPEGSCCLGNVWSAIKRMRAGLS